MTQLQNRSINITNKRCQSNIQAREHFEHILQGKYINQNRILANSSDGSNQTIRIEKLLGKGGYGEVYKVCYINQPTQYLALKIPRDPLEITRNYINNEIQKLNTLQRIGSKYIPKIIPFYFFWGQEQIPCYLTHIYKPIYHIFPEFLNNEPVDPVNALKLFYLITLGLKHITSNHIVHNDIKPENIMFYGETPIITDYGTARSNSEINEVEIERILGRLHGTPIWLPPELISIRTDEYDKPYVYYNLSKVCQKTDVWGLGLILMRCLTGRNLFSMSSIDTFSTPDVFLKIKHLFNEKNILRKYKHWCQRYMNRLYQNNDVLQKQTIDIQHIRSLLGSLPTREFSKSLTTKKKRKEDMFSSGRFMAAKLLMKKIELMSRSRSDVEIRDFFIEILFELYDICTAPLMERVKIYRLANTLEQVFPGLREIDTRSEIPDLGVHNSL
ncbi:protein kinase [Candidatus Uabimicrobium sp. HlEnr_7]|uniref:protein kinase domain-containing protein n=1 Tax=Candidatus Uabimicrobium helgolandensis TaxID=3095367 RepID=UPI00355630AB